MPQIRIDADDLLRWARYFHELPNRSKGALARGLNAAGDLLVTEYVRLAAQDSGLDPNDLRGLVVVNQATPDDLSWTLDASSITLLGPHWERLWQGAPQEQSMDQNALLKVVTAEDHTVCDVCNRIAAEGPYTVEQINQFAAQWAEYEPPHEVVGPRTNLLHPNCRCVTQPFQASRRLPVSIGDDFSRRAPSELMTIKQLAKVVDGEVLIEMKVHDV